MNTIKCPDCGVVNFSTASNCLQCRSVLDPTAIPSAESSIVAVWKKGRHIFVPVLYGVWGLVFLFMIYTVVIKEPTRKARPDDASAQPPEAVAAAVISVAAPPVDYGVTQPRIEGYSKLIQDELMAQNGVWTMSGSDGPQSSVSADDLRDRFYKGVQEKMDRMGDFCKGVGYGSRQCIDRERNLEAGIVLRENRKHLRPLQYCPPKVEGEATIAEPGRYHRLGDQIFYGVKVRALEGVHEGGACRTKPSIVPLTARVYLKWSPTTGSAGWQASDKDLFQTTSLAYHKQVSAGKKEEREKLRYEKWQQRGREQAAKRLHDRVFRPLQQP